MYLLRQKRLRIHKCLSILLAIIFTVNLCAMIRISTHGMDESDYIAECNEIIENAATYINSRQNSDYSFGDNKTINDTTDALLALKCIQDDILTDSEKWISDNISTSNIDMVARFASAAKNPEYLAYIEKCQNEDGGFGLYPDFSSNVLDSVLVLDAINETGYNGSVISADSLWYYLLNSVNEDGGLSYNEANNSDVILSAMALYSTGRYFTAKSYDTAILTNIAEYLKSNIQDDYSDNMLEKTIYKHLALYQYGEEPDAVQILESLAAVQKNNGSFANNIHITSLVIRLLKTIDYENRIKVTSFNTTLSNSTGSTSETTLIQAAANIEYSSNYDADLTLKFTVFNGDNIIYENLNDIILHEAEFRAEINVGEFILSEPSDEGVYALTELYNGDTLIKSQTIEIEITDSEDVYSTEINNLSVTLDKQSSFTDTADEVNVSYNMLYATNIEQTVEMKTIVTKDGTEITSATESAVLIPEKNSISNNSLKFIPDASEAGVYEISVICLYQNAEICRNSAEYTIVEAPVIEEPSENEPAQFEVTWFGPILSDYYVYAGNETDIYAGAEINYFSNDIFNGFVELSAYCSDECISETKFDVSLEKGIPAYFDGKAIYPVYKNESQLAFTVKNAGEYTVYAKLFDSDGNLVSEGSRKLRVIEKPVQDLILNSKIDSETENMVNLSWNDISNEAESYSYQLFRKSDGASWEPRSIWNEEESIDVLNVYPQSPYLVDWMNNTISNTELPAGKGIFNIDSVHIPAFNSEPYSYLIDENGLWKYDVIFFGSSDCNSGYDLNELSTEALHKYIDSGRGVLFGHDTICGGSSSILRHKYFNDFAEQAGLVVKTPNPEVWYRTTSVSVVKIGTLTNYPWNIRGDLTVPNTHSTGQYLFDATEWITLNATKRVDEETGAVDNFYLCTKNNIGMIQTGDSTGQASDDERKILANTLFYLYQISQQTTAKDASFYDIDAPDMPAIISSENINGQLMLNVSSEDNATEYEYYIKAIPSTDTSAEILSNVEKHEILSGLAGFVVGINASSEASPELIEYDEDRENILNIIPADINGNAVISVSPTDFTNPQYVHIFAVDNANNISEEYIIPFDDTSIVTNIKTDKKLYSYGETVSIDTDTLSAPFGRTADMTIEILDEFDNKTAEIITEQNQPIMANESFISSEKWSIPENLKGRYKAVISWKNDDELIASDETEFKIANEQSIGNSISSDKHFYSLSEPVNLVNTVYNNSGMIENDLMLYVTVYDSSSAEAAAFEYNVSSLNPMDEGNYSDAIAPGVLPVGNYTATAKVIQGELELSSDSVEFSVNNDVSSFDGTLALNADDTSASAEFSVTNNGSANAENVVISVNVYKEETSELVYSFTQTASISAGDTLSFNESFTPDSQFKGTYSGVLSVEYLNESQALDYDGFNVEVPVSATTTETTTSTTTENTTVTTVTTIVTTTAHKTDSPLTGVKDIPAYMWIVSILSLAGIVIFRKKGENRNENN